MKKVYNNRRTVVLGFIIFIAMVVIGIYVSTITVEAKTKVHKVKYFTSVYIEEGDSLWSIANDYYTDDYTDIQSLIDEIKKSNNLSSDNITAGCYLVIPYYLSN